MALTTTLDPVAALDEGDGTGPLSPAAHERLGRPSQPPLRPPPADDPVAVARWRDRVHRAWLDGDPDPADRGHRAERIGGVRCLVAAGADGATRGGRPTILYLHGGGYALGSPEVAVPITDRLRAAGPIVSVDYRLAPEAPAPAAIEDATAVYRALVSTGRSIVVAGDSAGANLALSVALRAPGTGPGPRGLVLLSPHLDHGEPASDGPRDPRSDVDDEARRWLRQAYCGSLAPDDPTVSPLRADLTSLPPTLVQVGSIDQSLSDGARFARLARRAGVPVTLDVWPGLWHTWHYHRDLPEADRALAEAATFIGDR